jgi:hypothetical protein
MRLGRRTASPVNLSRCHTLWQPSVDGETRGLNEKDGGGGAFARRYGYLWVNQLSMLDRPRQPSRRHCSGCF